MRHATGRRKGKQGEQRETAPWPAGGRRVGRRIEEKRRREKNTLAVSGYVESRSVVSDGNATAMVKGYASLLSACSFHTAESTLLNRHSQ